eukprot:g1536.t1
MWDAKRALRRVRHALRHQQFPTVCRSDRILVVQPFYYGLSSIVRDYGDLLMVGLRLNRTIVLDRPASKGPFTGCKEPYLDCFFLPQSNCSLRGGTHTVAVESAGSTYVNGKYLPAGLQDGVREYAMTRSDGRTFELFRLRGVWNIQERFLHRGTYGSILYCAPAAEAHGGMPPLHGWAAMKGAKQPAPFLSVRELPDTPMTQRGDLMRWPFDAPFVPNTGLLFPEWLWDELVREGIVKLDLGPAFASRVRPANRAMLAQLASPELATSMKVSMLRSLLVGVAFTFRQHMRQMARTMLESQGYAPPMLAIHMRRTDKGLEDPFYAAFGHFMPTRYFFKIARTLEEHMNITFASVFVMSDSPAALRETRQHGWARREMRSDPAVLHNTWLERQTRDEVERGHSHVPLATKLLYQQNFVAELAAASHASYVVAGGSSGVGQMIAQSIAARTGVDPNVFGIWIEDWIGHAVPDIAARFMGMFPIKDIDHFAPQQAPPMS